jgi:glycosyltransferase involved in cell wall biosynthesis
MFDQVPVFRNHTLWEFFGVKGLRKFGGYLYILSLLWYLWRRRAAYDIIHIHGFSYHTFTAALAGRWFGRKTVVKLANSGRDSDIRKMHNNYELALSEYMLPTALTCNQFVAVNRRVVDEIINSGVPPAKVIELGNGIEYERIIPKKDYALHSPARIIFIGRLHEQKDLNTLLSAFRRLEKLYRTGNLCLQLLGDGPQREELVALAECLGIIRQVKFLGRSERVMDYLSQADIFVLPSRAEGLSNALLEAMSCALPVVVSKIPGNTDIVEHDKTGLLFTPGDPESLAQSLQALVNQSELRQRLGRAARQVIVENYSLDKIADQYIDLYQGLLMKDDEQLF